MPIWSAVMKKILDDTNTPYSQDIIKIITPLGAVGTAKYFIEIGCPLSLDEILRKMSENLIREYTLNVPAKEGVVETLKALKARGDSINVLTASRHEALDPCLKRLGIFDIFDNVWSCDDFETTKANPEIYKMAAEKMGVAVGDAIFLDDNFNAVKTAKTAGMRVFGVYDKSSEEYTEEMKSISERYISDFSQLI